MSQSVSEQLTIESLETHLQEAQRLYILGAEGNETFHKDLVRLIEEQIQLLDTQSPLGQFMLGQRAFYAGQYRLALQHYLSAQSVPQMRFFHYRCSACVAHELGRRQMAVSLAREALELRPSDVITLQLLEGLLDAEGAADEAQMLRQQIHDITESTLSAQEQSEQSLGLGEQEFNDLANLFKKEPPTMKEDTQFGGSTVVEPHQTTEGISESEVQTVSLQDSPIAPTLEESATTTAEQELNQLAESDYASDTNTSSSMLNDSLGLSFDAGLSLEERIRQFQRRQVDDLSMYIQRAGQRPQINDKHMYILHGWNQDGNTKQEPIHALLPNRYSQTTGGYFIRWGGKGIVINPGPDFVDTFHNAGFHIKDIDYVVVTKDCREAHGDIQAIYDLNYRVNKMDSTLHIINYYLNQQAHRQLASSLKPHFKQERNTVHSLELYVDSPEVETLPLTEEMTLEYFPTYSPDADSTPATNSVGICLQLESNENGRQQKLRVGYVSGTGYSPVIGHHLSNTDVLITGFGSTDANDYGKIAYTENELGFFGTHSLIQEIAPRLIISSEYSGKDGDIRVEVAKKLRQETNYQSTTPSVILPGDKGLVVDLETQRVLCSVSHTYVEPTQVHVVKTQEARGQLNYLSPSCFI